MTIEEMRERKKELGYTYEKIAELSGLPVGTVQQAHKWIKYGLNIDRWIEM